MSGWYKLDGRELDAVQNMMEHYGETAERTINDVLHHEGAEEIQENIYRILPVSGRKWRKKHRAAVVARPLRHYDEMLAVTVVARGTYHYLYFPDDGSNTHRHVGNQQFMRRGAEASVGKIIDICVGKLTESFK